MTASATIEYAFDQEEDYFPPPTFTLTADQQAALDAFYLFLLDPIETVFVLSGYSGCGKSTLVKTLLERLPNFQKTIHLINPSGIEYEPELTATTNKAAENLARITGREVRTIHSALGLRVQTDFRTNTTTLVARPMEPLEHKLLLIDEYSTVDNELLGFVFSRTKNCKVVFIGDPAQLLGVKATSSPVSAAGFRGAALTTVVRQAAGNPIVDLSTKFRNTVNTDEFFSFVPDGHHVRHLGRVDFNAAIEAEFTRADWAYEDSKILGWTNKCVIGYNQYVRNLVKGDPHFAVGDYAVCNQYLEINKKILKTDQLVMITSIEPDTEIYGVRGNWLTVNHDTRTFLPKSLAEKNAAIKQARAKDEINLVAQMENTWIDLRGAYAQTVDKSQGSTYGKVFIDLDDIRRCNSGNRIARMLYVGVSRARDFVYFTGDLA